MDNQDDKIINFLKINKVISLIIFSFLQEFFDENKLWNNLVIRIRYKKFSQETNKLEFVRKSNLWSNNSLPKNTLFTNARHNILIYFRNYLQTSCRDIFSFMDFSNRQITIRMNLVITDEIPITININTMNTSHQSLSYYTLIEITYKSNKSYDTTQNMESYLFASGRKTIYHIFPTRTIFAIDDSITQNVKCKNIISFRTSNYEFVMNENIDDDMIKNSKHFIKYFIKTHFLHDVSNHIKITIILTKIHNNDDYITFDKIGNNVQFTVNKNQNFYANKCDMFLCNSIMT